MKNFVDSLCDYNYSGVKDEESSDEEEAAIVIETDQSKPVVTRRLISQNWSVTVTLIVRSEEEDIQIDDDFDEPIDLSVM